MILLITGSKLIHFLYLIYLYSHCWVPWSETYELHTRQTQTRKDGHIQVWAIAYGCSNVKYKITVAGSSMHYAEQIVHCAYYPRYSHTMPECLATFFLTYYLLWSPSKSIQHILCIDSEFFIVHAHSPRVSPIIFCTVHTSAYTYNFGSDLLQHDNCHTMTDQFCKPMSLPNIRSFLPLIALLVHDGALTYIFWND